jgi:hypothetical protein
MPISLNGSSGIAFNNGFVLGSGQSNILQVKRAYAGPVRQTIASLTPVLITGLSLNITPISALSTMIITANVTASNGFVISFGIFKDGVATVSTAGQTNTNEPNMQATSYIRNDNNYFTSTMVMHYETSANTNARTYAVYGTSGWSGVVYTFYVNDRNPADMACFSTIDVMEVLI